MASQLKVEGKTSAHKTANSELARVLFFATVYSVILSFIFFIANEQRKTHSTPLINFYRAERPDDNISNLGILSRYAHENGADWLQRKYPGDYGLYLEEIGKLRPLGPWEEAKRGHRRNLLKMKSSIRGMTSWGLGKFMGREFSKQQLSIGANQLHEAAKPWLQSSSTQPAFSGLGETLALYCFVYSSLHRSDYPQIKSLTPATHSARNIGPNRFREVLIEFKK